MRADSLGLFWQDMPAVRGKGSRGPRERGPMPPIPATGWTSPADFPNLSAAKTIGFDTETWDPELLDAGPGWGRGKGHIIGASLSVDDGSSWYFPIRHGIDETGRQVLPEHEAGMNMDPATVLRYLDHVLHDSRPKVGANAIYDVGWLAWEGARVGGPVYDVQFGEALLNSETPSVALDQLAATHLGQGKVTEALYEWLADWLGGKVNDRQRKNLFLSPPSLAGPYACADASLPVAILHKQWPLLEARGVLELFQLECRLIPLLVAMRLKGAPVNLQKADEVHSKLGDRLVDIEANLKDVAGGVVNPNAGESIATAFKRLGLALPRKLHKESGEMRVSFDKDRLGAVDHPIANIILEHRKLSKVRNTFVESYIQNKSVNSRVYTSFHPLKGGAHGARSGRFASSGPNLQNIPVRTEEGKMVRDMFDGTLFGNRWRSFDYSSIEYRLLVHYAVGEGADEVRRMFAMDPTVDYHAIVGEMIKKMTGLVLKRTKVKTINFGIIYGMALNALATALKVPRSEASVLLTNYHEAIPYARATMDACAKEVHRTGHVRTILNRASDFTSWGPKGYQDGGRPDPASYEVACRKWGMYNIERQATHKALNRKLQGSAADVMKKAMVHAWEGGLFAEDACGIPVLTVHDELDFEDKGDLDNPAWGYLKHTMETCMGNSLRVPLLVEGQHAPTWRDAH